MTGYFANIQQETLTNTNFRRVLFTGQHCQLVVMSLLPGEEIGLEVHGNVDQFFRIEQGRAKFIINGEEYLASDDFAVIVPAGAEHKVINVGDVELKLYTIYSPANHPAGTVHTTKAEADAAEQHEHERLD
ncbi:MAG: cupin domain-containing protein [Patescibacteria group bacterium]